MKISALLIATSFALSGAALTAGEDKPPTPPDTTTPKPPTPPNPPPPRHVVAGVAGELNLLLTDLLNGDAAKRDAAGKGLVAKGAPAHRTLGNLINNADADVAKRAKDIRDQIEKRGIQLYQDASLLQANLQKAPLTAAALDEVRKAWIVVGTYAPQNEVRQAAVQAAQVLKSQQDAVEAANRTVVDNDALLAAAPPPSALIRASLHMARVEAFATLQRFDDALKAAQDAYDAGGKDCRLAPAALRAQLELQQRKLDNAKVEALCKKIIADYADSLEARFAYGVLADSDLYVESKRYDEAVEAVKNFINVCPLEEEAQDAAEKLLGQLMDKERDYPRVYGFSGWLKGRLPASRIKPDVLLSLAYCSEFAVKDYAKAEAVYKALAAQYADTDEVKAVKIDAMLARAKARGEGKLPKEPKSADEGPAGVLAQFLAAVRAKDAKGLATLLPESEAAKAADLLTGEESELVANVTFADYVIKSVKAEENKADLTIDYYDKAGNAPHPIAQRAIKEKDAWKIQWDDPEAQVHPAPKKPKVEVKGVEQK